MTVILLVGPSGSGKTHYVLEKHKDVLILHASDFEELMNHISQNFSFKKNVLLVNVWFKLSKDFVKYADNYEVYLELHADYDPVLRKYVKNFYLPNNNVKKAQGIPEEYFKQITNWYDIEKYHKYKKIPQREIEKPELYYILQLGNWYTSWKGRRVFKYLKRVL